VSSIRFVAIAVATAALGVACEQLPTALPHGATSTAPLFDSAKSTTSSNGGVHCTPLPDAAVHRLVGPEGADIAIGPHRLVIPPGSLERVYKIEAVIDQDLVRHTTHVKFPTGSAELVSSILVNAVHLRPRLRFQRPATLTLSFANCDVDPVQALRAKVVYTNPVMNVIREVLPSVVDADKKSVSAELGHFSNYAVAW
jgi:hypothetical protein